MVYEMKFGQFLLHIQNSVLVIAFYYYWKLACENSRFSSLFAAEDVSRGGTSATRRKKFHNDDVINVYIIYLVVMGSTSKFVQFHVLLVDFTKVLFSSAKELQQTSNASSKEEYIPPILTVLLELHRVYIRPSWPFVFCQSFVNKS